MTDHDVTKPDGSVLEGEVLPELPVKPLELFPSRIGVFCDRCRVVNEQDYMVHEDDDQRTRFGYARTHLNGLGWRCDEQGDFCPTCKDKSLG